MKNTFGRSVAVTLFGESHGDMIGVVLDGLAPGIPVEEDRIAAQLDRRRPWGEVSTRRRESDRFQIVSGVFRGKTTGTPVCILIPNESTRSGDYEALKDTPRPSHADYTAQCKYHGFQDYRGGGHFSGRLTAPLVAGGAIALAALEQKGILVGTHVKACGGAEDRSFGEDPRAEIGLLRDRRPAVLDEAAGEEMLRRIKAAAARGDSLGGILETAVTGLPAGLGEPWFDTVEGVLAHGLFSIPAVKGVEFGLGFGFGDRTGSEANDGFRMGAGGVETVTNHNGGVNGGITSGMPVLFRCAVKPTPSIFLEQQTVNLKTGAPESLRIRGRHDPAIVHRAAVVADSVTALILCDLLAERFGTDYFAGES